jgi:hypothetical protein
VIATTKYHWIDIQSKNFDGGLSTPTVKGLNKIIWNTTMATYQPQFHFSTPNTKGGWIYDKKVIASTKYHWIDIQSKDFDGGLSTPTVKGFNKIIWNTTMATYQPQLHFSTSKTKGGWTYDKIVIATTKYHWIDIQSKDFDGGLSIPTVKGYETLPWLRISHSSTYQHQIKKEAEPVIKWW